MSDPASFPYDTRLNVLHGPLELIDVAELARAATHPWYNQTLTRVNDAVVRVGVIQGEYHWHHHDVEDEFFYVVSGRLFIDLDAGHPGGRAARAPRTVELAPMQGFMVPHGVRHRTRAPGQTVILMVEPAGIIPTGD